MINMSSPGTKFLRNFPLHNNFIQTYRFPWQGVNERNLNYANAIEILLNCSAQQKATKIPTKCWNRKKNCVVC